MSTAATLTEGGSRPPSSFGTFLIRHLPNMAGPPGLESARPPRPAAAAAQAGRRSGQAEARRQDAPFAQEDGAGEALPKAPPCAPLCPVQRSVDLLRGSPEDLPTPLRRSPTPLRRSPTRLSRRDNQSANAYYAALPLQARLTRLWRDCSAGGSSTRAGGTARRASTPRDCG